MSQALTLARPYARAAFALAKEGGRLPQWSAMLGFAAQAAAVPGVQTLVGNPLAKASRTESGSPTAPLELTSGNT